MKPRHRENRTTPSKSLGSAIGPGHHVDNDENSPSSKKIRNKNLLLRSNILKLRRKVTYCHFFLALVGLIAIHHAKEIMNSIQNGLERPGSPNTSTMKESNANIITESKMEVSNAATGSEIEEVLPTDLSVVIVTNKKYNHLDKLLESLVNQKPKNFEIVVVDNGCLSQTKQAYDKVFFNNIIAKRVPHKYVQACDKPEDNYKHTDNNAKWMIMLNDGLILQGEDFLHNMMDISIRRQNVGAVTCKLLSEEGEEVINAGQIIWQDATSYTVGHRKTHINAPLLSYERPIDYGSGKCLMIKKEIFINYGGFDYKNFPEFYEDADIQMHIQHTLSMEVWFQPKSIAFHDEGEDTTPLMMQSKRDLWLKWKRKLNKKHLASPADPHSLHGKLAIKRASDLRARDPNKANILWLEQKAPNKENGSGFGRAYDNLSMVAELGHRITVVVEQQLAATWCNKECRKKIAGLGVELVDEDWEEYAEEYIGLYDIVYISRPSTMEKTYEKWRKLYEKHSFRVIYDCEALWFNRDKMLLSYIYDKNIQFPGGLDYFDITSMKKIYQKAQNLKVKYFENMELEMLRMADSIIPVSHREAKIVSENVSNAQVQVIGHIMNIDKTYQKYSFHDRNGILFLGSFSNKMYYNGDAAWYFITQIYPLVLKEAKLNSSTPIPLTIAGKGIPTELIELVKGDRWLSKHIVFRESVRDIRELYNKARIFIAPHIYGAGIQYKVRFRYRLLYVFD